MKQNKIILILAFMAVFLITNGTFFALCEKDIVLDCINKLGNWSQAGLWHSSIVFLYYAVADTFYNIRYIAPKLAYTLAPVKWADKLNGWFGGSSIGELEKHLAQDNYYPLYKDALNGLTTNVGIPLYNNFYAPLIGIKPKKQVDNISMAEPIIFELTKEKTKYVNKVRIIEKHDEDVLALCDEVSKARLALDKLAISKSLNISDSEILNEIRGLSCFEEAATCTTTQLNKLYTDYYMLLADEDRGAELIPQKLKYLEFHKSYNFVKVYFDHPSKLFINVPMEKFKSDFPLISKLVKEAITPIENQREEFGSDGVWRIKNITAWAYVELSYDSIRHSWLRTTFNLSPENCLFKVFGDTVGFDDLRNNDGRQDQSGLLIDKIRNNLMETVEREQTSFDTQLTSIENNVIAYIQRNNPQDDNSSVIAQRRVNNESAIIDGSIASETVQWLPAASVGVLTTLTVGQALVVFSYFFGIETFQTMIQTNTHVQDALIALYNSNNMEMPTILSDAINNSPAHSSNNFIFDSNSSLNGTPSGADNSIFKYLGYGVLMVGAIGLTCYLYKYGVDSSSAVETAKTFKESLHDKYVNFK